MSAESPPFATHAGSFDAEQTRRAAFAWAARTSANQPGIIAGGLLSASDCQVTAPASGMSVNLSTGEMLIGGTEGGSQGAYGPCRVTSQTNLAIAAADPTNPRIDLVCGTVNDPFYTSPSGGVASGQWAPIVITGTPTAGASLSNLSGAPALPASSLLLAYVLVPNGSTSIITADIQNVAGLVNTSTSPHFLQSLAGSGWRVNTGTGTASFSGAANTPVVNVAHGLGAVPVWFCAIPTNNFNLGFWLQLNTQSSWTSTTVEVTAFAPTAPVNQTVDFNWIAIG